MEEALRQLFILDCLDHDGELTSLGQRLAKLPLDPALGRILVAAAHSGCLQEALSVCAMLSADSIFVGNRQPPWLTLRSHHHSLSLSGMTGLLQTLTGQDERRN